MEGDKYFNLATGEQPFNFIEYDFGVVHVPCKKKIRFNAYISGSTLGLTKTRKTSSVMTQKGTNYTDGISSSS